MKTSVIVNRYAHKGGAGQRWPAIKAELEKRLGPVEPQFTQAPGHATRLARDALAGGTRRFVAVGGDGTVNETLNGLLDPSGRLLAPDAVLCPIPAGTANELCRALGHGADPSKAYDAAAATGRRAIDLVRVRCIGADGRPVERFGYLMAALGAAALVSQRTSQSRWAKKLGDVAYMLMAPAVILGFRSRGVAITVDGIDRGTRKLFTALIANTENGGGGLRLAPGAAFDDGLLDLVEVGDVSRLGALLGVLPRMADGSHVVTRRCARAAAGRSDSCPRSRRWSIWTGKRSAGCHSTSTSCRAGSPWARSSRARSRRRRGRASAMLGR
jgi:diacylglycerol kinase family enzyme